LQNPVEAITQNQLDDSVRNKKAVFTQDVMLLARSELVDLIVDTTGSVEFGAHVLLEAFNMERMSF
jgi:predicted homoserine dehydrogenase-like protein